MIRFYFLWMFFFSIVMLSAQSYDNSMVDGANAIIDYDHTTITITSAENFEEQREFSMTILNQYATRERRISIGYDEFSQIMHMKIAVRGANGKIIEKYSLKDMQDWSVGSDVASDNRTKYIDIRHNQYPYTIEAEYKTSHNGSLHYPVWYAQPGSKLAVAEASLTVTTPNKQLRYVYEDIDSFDSLVMGESTIYKWTINDRKAFDYENYSGGLDVYSPYVLLAPTRFTIDGIFGNMSSWKSFGHFIRRLNHAKNTLTDAQRNEIRELVRDDMSELEKVRVIYSYLQRSTRYVSIQLGIGGWSPFDAGFVHEKKYGDCKALSFYTKSALEEVGIDSYYTLITARPFSPLLKENFPNAYFNHAILTVPLREDTVWLECTSQTSPFGYMGTFTGNRKALLISDAGGHVINTKYYRSEENLQTTRSTFSVSDDGSMHGYIKRTYQGLEIENDNFNNVYRKNEKEQKDWFSDNIPLSNFQITRFSVDSVSQEVVPTTGFSLELEANKVIRKTGNRYFIEFTPLTKISYINTSQGERTKDLVIRYGYSQKDSITYQLRFPGSIETGMNDVYLETDFGQYIKKIGRQGNQITCYRYFQLNDGNFSRTRYSEFVDFIKQVQKADRKKIVILSKT